MEEDNEFDSKAFWEAHWQEERQDRELFQKIKKQRNEQKSNIVQFPLALKFQLDIDAIEDRLMSISVLLDDVMFEMKELKRRLGSQ